MRHALHFPQNFEALRALVQKAGSEADSVVMQTGHFLLFPDEISGELLPCIGDELMRPEHESIRRDYAQFPSLTWKLGLRLLASLPAPRKYVMIVVNDWQYVPPETDRGAFYDNHRSLPISYQQELDRYPSITMLRPSGDPEFYGATTPFFSESRVRNHYRKAVKRLIKRGALPSDASILQQGDVLSCQLLDPSGEKREIYCSERSTDCAGETAQFLSEAAGATGCKTFINLFPAVCWDFVEYGTKLGHRLFAPGITSYLNIGLPSTEVHEEESMIAGGRCSLLET
jgi:hypothetical protein